MMPLSWMGMFVHSLLRIGLEIKQTITDLTLDSFIPSAWVVCSLPSGLLWQSLLGKGQSFVFCFEKWIGTSYTYTVNSWMTISNLQCTFFCCTNLGWFKRRIFTRTNAAVGSRRSKSKPHSLGESKPGTVFGGQKTGYRAGLPSGEPQLSIEVIYCIYIYYILYIRICL